MVESSTGTDIVLTRFYNAQGVILTKINNLDPRVQGMRLKIRR